MSKQSLGSQVIMALLWYWTFSKKKYPDQSPAHKQAVDYLITQKMLVAIETEPGNYATTERGGKWAQVLCRTPAPQCKKMWVDAAGEVV